MSVEFTVLASGSRGNASLVRAGGSGLLIDLGLGPRTLARRMEECGARWDGIATALLTHTHGDHVRDASLRALATRGIPLYCHEGHREGLAGRPGFDALERAGCVRHYDDMPFLTPDGLRVEPIALSHDGGPTYGFRIEARPHRRGRPIGIGYLADTGCWRHRMAEAVMDVDVLGVEFNHDVELQRRSGRSSHLIYRNLGDRGHLSNDQGAALVSAVLEGSSRDAVRHVVLLHLSEQCNRPNLALSAARSAVRGLDRSAKVHVASQWSAFPHLPISPLRRRVASASGFPWEVDGPSEPAPFRLTVE